MLPTLMMSAAPIPAPATIKIYTLIKRNGWYFSYTGVSGTPSMGLGFFESLADAEKARLMEVLKQTADSKDEFLIFELDIPNPAYKS